MATQAITSGAYKLYPSPHNLHRTVFDLQTFVPYPYALIYLPDFYLAGKATLFAACRLHDMKMGQLVTLELAVDEARFISRFVPD